MSVEHGMVKTIDMPYDLFTIDKFKELIKNNFKYAKYLDSKETSLRYNFLNLRGKSKIRQKKLYDLLYNNKLYNLFNHTIKLQKQYINKFKELDDKKIITEKLYEILSKINEYIIKNIFGIYLNNKKTMEVVKEQKIDDNVFKENYTNIFFNILYIYIFIHFQQLIFQYLIDILDCIIKSDNHSITNAKNIINGELLIRLKTNYSIDLIHRFLKTQQIDILDYINDKDRIKLSNEDIIKINENPRKFYTKIIVTTFVNINKVVTDDIISKDTSSTKIDILQMNPRRQFFDTLTEYLKELISLLSTPYLLYTKTNVELQQQVVGGKKIKTKERVIVHYENVKYKRNVLIKNNKRYVRINKKLILIS
jgi:hypothetical protein